MKFSEMPYERPDIEALKKFLDDAAARLAAARSFEEADAVFLEVERGTAHAETMLTIAHIRHDINTADEFYDKEVEFSDRALPSWRSTPTSGTSRCSKRPSARISSANTTA